ncbi:hypothetical protein [Actinosynnema sp. NPDC023587]|uniref:hypothetical protein n=1 Tax=Actinosynnema sp. NPDC023587 TaxID=3154695 RepID=UPI0033F72596
MTARPSDTATRTGVSEATGSRVVNGTPGVPPATSRYGPHVPRDVSVAGFGGGSR